MLFIPRPFLSLALLIPFPLFLLQQHFRLLSLYPTHRVSPSLEISTRSDQPGKPTFQWFQPTSGDQWTADVPRHWLSYPEDKTREEFLATAFARAFWRSWALRLEERVMRHVIGIERGPFAFHKYGEDNVGEFEVGQKVLGGLVRTPSLHSFFFSSVKLPVTHV